ncbi:hypothetical protein FOMPIDRAFT_1056471 [Fomitopsis schrenkii]|uniref:Uncharacterized protein n=1 Tax=Fomitopsis schrenkii TaxID=2126942 RepID=S8DJ67_FOMSC|nr:hypothetical protein FOMPIDRAFT_1056471 [Fomitopsis schrenkii]
MQLLEHDVGPALDRRFECVLARQLNHTSVVYSDLEPKIEAVEALSLHTHYSSRSTTEDLYASVSDLAAKVVLAKGRIDALATILEEVSRFSTDPVVLEALSTIESLMQTVLDLLRVATTVHKSRHHTQPAHATTVAAEVPSAPVVPSAAPSPALSSPLEAPGELPPN